MYAEAKVVVIIIALLVAALTDIRRGRIYNWLTVPTVAVGVALNAADGGLLGALQSLGAVALALGLGLFGSLFGRVLGGGDVKLLAGVGAVGGPHFLLAAFALSAIAGGVMAIAVLVARRDLLGCLRRIGAWGRVRLVCRPPVDLSDPRHAIRLPFAVAIAAGTVGAMCTAWSL